MTDKLPILSGKNYQNNWKITADLVASSSGIFIHYFMIFRNTNIDSSFFGSFTLMM